MFSFLINAFKFAIELSWFDTSSPHTFNLSEALLVLYPCITCITQPQDVGMGISDAVFHEIILQTILIYQNTAF